MTNRTDPVPRTDAAPTVSIHSGRVVFDDEPLFEDLNVTFPGGAWTSLLGPSGVGKSTLLRLVPGLETGLGNGGTVRCSDGLPAAGRVALMAQTDLLFPWLTVIENVTLGLRMRGQAANAPAARERAMRLLDAVGLAASRDAWPDTLSGGMRQRVALARTLMEDRPIVLMDEPFSGLDAITKLRLQNLSARLLHGRTVLMVPTTRWRPCGSATESMSWPGVRRRSARRWNPTARRRAMSKIRRC